MFGSTVILFIGVKFYLTNGEECLNAIAQIIVKLDSISLHLSLVHF